MVHARKENYYLSVNRNSLKTEQTIESEDTEELLIYRVLPHTRHLLIQTSSPCFRSLLYCHNLFGIKNKTLKCYYAYQQTVIALCLLHNLPDQEIPLCDIPMLKTLLYHIRCKFVLAHGNNLSSQFTDNLFPFMSFSTFQNML
jgi:hypothetical protein